MKRVLFVDDEEMLLEAIRNMLRKHRGEWEVFTAKSGAEGLALVEEHDFDIICSDMRMPGMDGAEFLEKAQAMNPASIRIVLTGQATKEHIVKATPYAHQFLPKPCDREVLEGTIIRLLKFKSEIDTGPLKQTILGLCSLPSTIEMHKSLAAALENKNSTIDEIALIIEGDIATASRVLQFANSAYVSPQNAITSIKGAISYLGFEFVRLLTLANEVFDGTGQYAPIAPLVNREGDLAVKKARFAREISKSDCLPHDAFAVGAFSSIGKVLIGIGAIEQGLDTDLIDLADADSEVQVEIVGSTAEAAAALFLGIRGLPFSVVEAIAFLRNPQEVAETNPLVRLAYAAEAFARYAFQSADGATPDDLPRDWNGENFPDSWYGVASQVFDIPANNRMRKLA